MKIDEAYETMIICGVCNTSFRHVAKRGLDMWP